MLISLIWLPILGDLGFLRPHWWDPDRARLNCVKPGFRICFKSLCPTVIQNTAKNACFFALDLSVLPISLLYFFATGNEVAASVAVLWDQALNNWFLRDYWIGCLSFLTAFQAAEQRWFEHFSTVFWTECLFILYYCRGWSSRNSRI